MWKTYSRTPRRFKVCVDSLTFNDYKFCNEDKLDETIQSFYNKYEIGGFTEIHVLEILEIDWDE